MNDGPSLSMTFWLALANVGMLLVLLVLAIRSREGVRSRQGKPGRTEAQREALDASMFALTAWLLSYVAKAVIAGIHGDPPAVVAVLPYAFDAVTSVAWWWAGGRLLRATRPVVSRDAPFYALVAASLAVDVWLVLRGSPQEAAGALAVAGWCLVSAAPGAVALDRLGRGLVGMAETSQVRIHLGSVGWLIRAYGWAQVPAMLLRELGRGHAVVAPLLAGSVLTVKALIGAGLLYALHLARGHDREARRLLDVSERARIAIEGAADWDTVRRALLGALAELGEGLELWIPRRTQAGAQVHRVRADGAVCEVAPSGELGARGGLSDRVEIPGLGGASGPAWVTSRAPLSALERVAVAAIGQAVTVRATGLERDRTRRMLGVFPTLRDAAEREDWDGVAEALRRVLGVDAVVIAFRASGVEPVACAAGAAPFPAAAIAGITWGAGPYASARTARVLATGERAILDDLDASDVSREAVRQLRDAARAAGVTTELTSWACVPMRLGDEVGAALMLFNRSPGDARLPSVSFSSHFVDMAEQVIAVLGTLLGMRKARLDYQVKAREAEQARDEARSARARAEQDAIIALVAREQSELAAERARQAEEREGEQRKLAVDRAEKAVQAETAAIAARRQAEQAAADAAKAKEDRTQVLALLAHELRAPNNTIRRLAGRLLREAAGEARRPLDPARLPQDLQLIQAEASRFEELFQNWRRVVDVVFHGRQPQARQVDLRACLERAFSEDLRLDAIARGFHVELPEVSIDARADDVLVERCLTNLLSNALKYGAEKPGDTVRVSLEALAGEVAVHVDDWGEGVPHHERKEIFKAYHRAQRHRDGTPIPGAGLGLYLVRQASVAMGGTVDVRNHKEMPQRPCGDRGARFTLTLPRWT